MDKYRRKLDNAKSMIRAAEATVEVALMAVSYYFVWRHGYVEGIFPSYFGKGKYVLAGVYSLLTVVTLINFEGFKFGHLKQTDVLVSQWISLFITNFITYFQLSLIANVMISVWPIVFLMVLEMLLSLCCVVLYTMLYHRLYAPQEMVLVYGRNEALVLKLKMDSRLDKYRITKLVAEEIGFEKICAEIVNYDAVIINDVSADIRNAILKFCYENAIRTYVAPKISDIILLGAAEITLFDTPLLLVRGRGLTYTQRFFKRVMDVVLCLISLILLIPVFLIVAIAIKIEDGGPVLFSQTRVTRDGNHFQILKFRSMIVDAEKEGISIPATEDDPRITRVGKFIRAARIDELPQILNILKGEMSIVGPRPERVEHIEQYSKIIPEFPNRLKVKGGLTGYAQIYGKYNTSAYDKLRLDLMYIENYSLLLDIKLIVLTFRTLLKKESTEGFDKAEEASKVTRETLESIIEMQDSSEPQRK